jgi:long-chain acyl-CoA synthetase
VVLRPYTSGTTGRPKAVIRAVGSTEAAIMGMVRYYESYGIAAPDEVNLTASPLHHLAGFSGPHSALIFGHTSVLLDHLDAMEAVRVIETERASYWICAPVHLYRLTQLPDEVLDAADLSSMRRVMHGSAPCAPAVKRKVMDLFPPGSVWETYGGTETMGTVITPEEWLERPGSVGRPALGSTIKILDDDGAELPAGETGLVYIGSDWGRGFRYAGPAELTESIYRGDLATLGDVGYVDDDGYLFVVDRRKDMVITGGANVYPAEVETVLVRFDRVSEVAVIGVPDDEYGEIVTAIVVSDGPVTGEEIMAFAREHLVAYKCPRRVELVDDLPRDPMGKIRKRDLRDQFA